MQRKKNFIKHIFKQGLLALSLVAHLQTANAAGLPDFNAEYLIERSGLDVAKVKVSLEQRQNEYVYSSTSETTGVVSVFRDDVISEHSRLTHNGHQLQPLEYRYTQRGRRNRDVYLQFDWQQKQVTNTVQKHSWSMEIPDGTLDKFSVQLGLMLALQNNVSKLVFPIADGGKLKTYRFSVVGRETIKTKAGQFETIKLKRTRKHKRRVTYMWCAPTLGYLPVRMQHDDDDDGSFVMELQKVSGF